MSDNPKFHFRRRAISTWKTSAVDSPVSYYLGMEGRITVGELREHFAENYPGANFDEVALNYATATWDEPATVEIIAERQAKLAWQKERTDAWQRRTYEELKAKFEGKSEEDL